IDQCRLRRHQERMAERQIGHRGAELDLRGEAGERRAERHAVRDILGDVGQMLAAIAFAVAKPVGEDKGLAILLQRLGIVSRRRMNRHDEETEVHAIPPGEADSTEPWRGASIKVMPSEGAVNERHRKNPHSMDDSWAFTGSLLTSASIHLPRAFCYWMC